MKTNLPAAAFLSLVSLLAAGSGNRVQAAVTVIDDFETGEGHFASLPSASGSNRRILASSTAVQSLTQSQSGTGGQELTVNRNTDPLAAAPAFPSGPGEWFFRHLSGGGTPANNTAIPNTGTSWVGFWMKTTVISLQVGLILDDTTAGGNNHEISTFLPVSGDGLWHLYQFELANAASWELFAGTQPGGGQIDAATVTIDALAFLGATGVPDSSAFYIDNVTYSTDGPIPVPEPSTLLFVPLAALAAASRRRR